MSVYVDKPMWKLGRMVMCHMLADTTDELHAMAAAIGLRREWFQDKPGSAPHYDVSKSLRAKAVALGAMKIDRRKVVEVVRQWRSRQQEHSQKAGILES